MFFVLLPIFNLTFSTAHTVTSISHTFYTHFLSYKIILIPNVKYKNITFEDILNRIIREIDIVLARVILIYLKAHYVHTHPRITIGQTLEM